MKPISYLPLFALSTFLASSATAEGFFPYTDPARVAEGAELYGEWCASCHGANLEGQENWKERDGDGYLPAPPHDETGHTWHHPDAQLFLITKFGTERVVGNGYKSNMMGFGQDLSDDQLLDVLAYIKSTWPDQVIRTHNDINARAN